MSETRPDVAGSRPARHSSAVDLPDPLGPTSAVIRPGIIAQEIPCRISISSPPGVGKDLRRSRASTAGPTALTPAVAPVLSTPSLPRTTMDLHRPLTREFAGITGRRRAPEVQPRRLSRPRGPQTANCPQMMTTPGP